MRRILVGVRGAWEEYRSVMDYEHRISGWWLFVIWQSAVALGMVVSWLIWEVL